MEKAKITEVVQAACRKLYGINVAAEVTYAEPERGDFATNVAFKLAPEVKKGPAEVAKELAKELRGGNIERAEAAGAGFINISMKDSYWAAKVAQIGPNYLKNNSGKSTKVQVEFISANPTGPLTLGNGRGGYNGDVLANVLECSGYKVEREYYINDAGNQITELGKSVQARQQANTQTQYSGEYIKELADRIPASSRDPGREAANIIVDEFIKPSVKKMGIQFDVWLSEERDLHKSGKVDAILSKLVDQGLVVEKDGARWLKGDEAEQADRVLVKADGMYSYLLVDIAYHYNKLVERGFNSVINLWGADHAAQVPALQLALKLLGLEGRLQILLFQLVRLIKDGKEYKVSKRAGTYVTIDELLAEVPSDVARFFFIMRSRDTHMDFDLDLAKQQNQKNPLYYIMYTYARTHSLLSKAEAEGIKPSTKVTQLTKLERLLIIQLLQLPELVTEISETYEVHKLSFYGIELSKLFHEYYEQERILDLPPKQAAQKLLLLSKYQVALGGYFKLLGIKPQPKM